MNVLNLVKAADGTIISASIDDKKLDEFVRVQQTLNGGELQATLVANFGEIVVTDQVLVSAPAIVPVFGVGSISGSTKATIAIPAGAGNHFTYKVVESANATPSVGDLITGSTTYVPGNDITGVTTGKIVLLYELDANNKVVKYVAHTLIAGDIKA